MGERLGLCGGGAGGAALLLFCCVFGVAAPCFGDRGGGCLLFVVGGLRGGLRLL